MIYTNDSMAVIQQKLNKGGTITWQKGTYDIKKQLILKAKSVINLNGARLRRCANIQSIFLNDCKTSTKAYNGDGDITITNGTFEGMGKYSPDNLVTFFHSHHIAILNCTFLDTRCHAIEINSSCDVVILGCKFLGYNTEEPHKEMIQMDAAYIGGFWKEGSSRKSKCYDGTMCKNITIEECVFDKSSSRDYPKACIGTHTQIVGGRMHRNIAIQNNTFTCIGNQSCLSLIGMTDVVIHRNTFNQYGRVARIYNKDFSYNLLGEKVAPKETDGRCTNICFDNNLCTGSLGDNKCTGLYIDNSCADNIKIINNEFEKKSDIEKYYLYVTTKGCKNLIVKDNKTKLKAKIK